MCIRDRASLWNNLIALVIMVAVASTLLPTVGVVGAAWAWAASRLALRALSTLHVWRSEGVHSLCREVLVAGVIIIAIWVPVGLAASFVKNDFASIVSMAAAGLVLHVGVFFMLRERLGLNELAGLVRQRGKVPEVKG